MVIMFPICVLKAIENFILYSLSRVPYVVDLVKKYVADMIAKFWSPAD